MSDFQASNAISACNFEVYAYYSLSKYFKQQGGTLYANFSDSFDFGFDFFVSGEKNTGIAIKISNNISNIKVLINRMDKRYEEIYLIIGEPLPSSLRKKINDYWSSLSEIPLKLWDLNDFLQIYEKYYQEKSEIIKDNIDEVKQSAKKRLDLENVIDEFGTNNF